MKLKRNSPKGAPFGVVHGMKHKTSNTVDVMANQPIQLDLGTKDGGTANNAPLFFGGLPATVVPRGTRAMTAKRINTEDKTHTITPHFRQVDVMGGYTAAAGSALLRGNWIFRRRGLQARWWQMTARWPV